MEIIDDCITVRATVSRAYSQWVKFEEFSLFMTGVQEVEQIDDNRLNWKAEIGKEWDIEIFEQILDERIVWRSVGGSKNSGRVNFTAISAMQTEVRMHLAYEPEGCTEYLSDNLGLMAAQVADDLERFKEFIEARSTGARRWQFPKKELQDAATALNEKLLRLEFIPNPN